MTRQVPVSELRPGDYVLLDEAHGDGFEVHGVDQDQGQVQLTDRGGQARSYRSTEAVTVR